MVGMTVPLAKGRVTPLAGPSGGSAGEAPLVTVVLVTYTRAGVSGETVRAVLGQTLGDFELIVCDDASTDATPSVMAEWIAQDPRIRYLR
jgi:glycosyltransferase involved in cell wall biosynthesis